MNIMNWIQFPLYIGVLLILVKPLGGYMARVYQGERTFLSPAIAPVERAVLRLAGVKSDDEMTWKTYAIRVLLFNLVGFFFLYLLLRFQQVLPLNPQTLMSVSPQLVVSSIFRTFRNHLVVVPPDVACSSTFSVPRVILACTSAWHTLTSRQTVHLGTRRPSWFCA